MKNEKVRIIYLILLIVNIILAITQLEISIIIRSDSCLTCADGIKESTSMLIDFMNRFQFLFLLLGGIFIIYNLFYLIYSITNKSSGAKILFICFSFALTPVTQYLYEYIQAMQYSDPYDMTLYKPMIYVYPEVDNTKVTIRLSNQNVLTSTYPKYEDEWIVIADRNGNLYDIKTNRNYYGLYWEGIDNSKIDLNDGFVVEGKSIAKFLEEKLEILGLNEREINEFIVYWLPKLEANKYNYIRFRTTDEINNYMKIYTDTDVDTLIRVYMDYKPLDNKIDVKEQNLNKVIRQGFTIVEWGGRELN